LTTRALDTLREVFGFAAFRPGQQEVIEHLLAGRSAAAVFPTGGGKSLCYQLPALLLPGLTLVVSPLIALMKDQIDQLRRRGVAAERIDSTLTADGYREVMDGLRSGALRMLYVAPERFNNERFREVIRRVRLSLFAVDEAHCISEWGHNFRPEYLKLARYRQLCAAERILALTATATPRVLEDICRGFDIASGCAVRTGFYRPNLTLQTTPVTAAERDALLVRRLRERPTGPTIVYVTLQRTAERVAGLLRDAGSCARAYHAGMEAEARASVQDWFLGSSEAVVVATIAFGMGIDKADIRYVYHYNLPKSLENMSQEIGRAGRDGEASTCEMMICPDDLTVVQNFAYGDTPSLAAVRGLLGELVARQDELALDLFALSRDHDIRQLVVRTLLTYLEIDGYLEAGTPSFSRYRFRPLLGSAEILARFDGERREFLRGLFKQAKRARSWFDVDLDEAAAAIAAPRDRVVRALDYLGERELLEVRSTGIRHRYRWLRRPDEVEGLARELHGRMLEHEAREIARLDQVLAFAAHDGCQTNRLSGHFGEPRSEPCGHCGWCLGGRERARLLPRPAPAIDDADWARATLLRAGQPELAEPRAFARFLAGLSSPRLTKARLGGHELFGCLAQVPFDTLLARARSG
jgi:ATP-dependent DNA helicase RecQ